MPFFCLVVGTVAWGFMTRRGSEKNVQAVIARLQELNPNFDGKASWKFAHDGAVIQIAFYTDEIADITPLGALTRLEHVFCAGSGNLKGKLSDLGPLRGLHLRELNCSYNRGITDITPLQGMPLEKLHLWQWSGADLDPLQGMPLKWLNCGNGGVEDLSSLQGLPLVELVVNYSFVTDLKPLKGMPLKTLGLRDNPIADLSPLKGMGIRKLNLIGTKVTDLAVLRDLPKLTDLECDEELIAVATVLSSLKNLKTINGRPVNVVSTNQEGGSRGFK